MPYPRMSSTKNRCPAAHQTIPEVFRKLPTAPASGTKLRGRQLKRFLRWPENRWLRNLSAETTGGGARITPAGEAVLEASAALNKVRNQILSDIQAGESPKLAALASELPCAWRIIPCVIEDIHGGMSMCKVKMKVCEGQYLRSSVTLESRQLLDLQVGKSVLALFKASAATVSKDKPEDVSRCFLFGQVSRLPQKDKGGEVTLRLPNGLNVVGFIRGNHGLEVGSEAYIQIPEQSVVIALLG